MIKISNTKIFNMEGAFRGLRNPLNSWDKADSTFGIVPNEHYYDGEDIVEYFHQLMDRESVDPYSIEAEDLLNKAYENCITECGDDAVSYACLGPKDIDLAQRMIAGGTDESKFLRQIFVSFDVEAPLYW